MSTTSFHICRLCLNNHCFVSKLFSVKENHEIKIMLNICTPEVNLEITVEDPKICFNCYDQLKNAYNFKRSILNTEERLTYLIEQHSLKNGKIRLHEYFMQNEHENCIKYETYNNEQPNTLCSSLKSMDDVPESCIKIESPKLVEPNDTFEICLKYEVTEEIQLDSKYIGLEDNSMTSDLVDFIEEKISDVSKYNKREYTCNKCEYKAERYDLLRNHSEKCKFDAKPKEYTCKYCSYTSIRNRNVIRHQYRHEGNKPYKCDLCSKAFVEKCALKDHIYRHMGKTAFSFKCSECGKEFKRKCHLNSHLIMTHPDFRPFICKVCQRGFPDGKSCQMHAKKHVESKLNSEEKI